jgi:hypothetical protein
MATASHHEGSGSPYSVRLSRPLGMFAVAELRRHGRVLVLEVLWQKTWTFSHAARQASCLLGIPAAFVGVCAIVIVWGLTDPIFGGRNCTALGLAWPAGRYALRLVHSAAFFAA